MFLSGVEIVGQQISRVNSYSIDTFLKINPSFIKYSQNKLKMVHCKQQNILSMFLLHMY